MIMEVNCLDLVNLSNSCNNSRSVVTPILKELQEIVPSFASFSLTHVGRTINVPAHQCAQLACTLDVAQSCLHQSPELLVSCLREIVIECYLSNKAP